MRRRDLTRGRDAVRFFLISRKADTEFVFDVDLARAQSDENPVYYVQYAHARICSVLAQWGGDESSLEGVDLAPLTAPREAALLAKLAEYPETLQKALEELGPHQVAFYLRELAGELHGYYNAERVLVDDASIKMARLALLCGDAPGIAQRTGADRRFGAGQDVIGNVCSTTKASRRAAHFSG